MAPVTGQNETPRPEPLSRLLVAMGFAAAFVCAAVALLLVQFPEPKNDGDKWVYLVFGALIMLVMILRHVFIILFAGLAVGWGVYAVRLAVNRSVWFVMAIVEVLASIVVFIWAAWDFIAAMHGDW